jgi:hypothetical protein
MALYDWLSKFLPDRRKAVADLDGNARMDEKFAHIRKMSHEFQSRRGGCDTRASGESCTGQESDAAARGDGQTGERRFSRRVDPSSDAHQLAAILEALARENRMYMAEYTEVMHLERQFDACLAKRTTNIIRISIFALVILSGAMIMLIYALTSNLNEITQHTHEMTKEMVNMRTAMNSITQDVGGIHGELGRVTHNFEEMNSQVWVMNGQMNAMKRDVNTMSSPMRMMPFRP